MGVERVVQCIRRSLAGSAPQDLTVINDDVYVYVRDGGTRKGLLFHRVSPPVLWPAKGFSVSFLWCRDPSSARLTEPFVCRPMTGLFVSAGTLSEREHDVTESENQGK